MSGWEIAFWIMVTFATAFLLAACTAWSSLDRIREELDGKR